MNQAKIIARRYAKGLMLVTKNLQIDLLIQEIKALVDVLLLEGGDLERLLTDPSFSPAQRKAVIDRLAEQFNFSQIFHRFLLLLVDKGRILLLPAIYESFLALIDERLRQIRAIIKSATPLDAAQLDAIVKALAVISKKEVTPKVLVEPELLGGIRVEMGSMIFDGTVKAKLLSLKNKLLHDVGTLTANKF